MEKIININFHGRVIPIEEGAYNDLKKYIDSLRGHFANEESSDEIINDIENRIAELFSERVKRGAACINNSDLNAVIESIGRLEDIEAAENEEIRDSKNSDNRSGDKAVKGRFLRNADDKVIAGVCSGIAAHTGIDPVVVRVLFVLLSGAFFWLYILLWIVVPSQSIQANITKRLYRNPDDRMIAGVCGGLSVYLNVDTWIPRLVFVLPLIMSVVSGSMHAFWWHWPHGSFFADSFGSTLFVLYTILWIALPYASSATDKMEMRGEKIDMNSIKAATQAKAGSGYSSSRRVGNGIGHAIGVLFKAFFMLMAGIMAVSLFGMLIGLFFVGMVAVPFTDFILDGWQQSVLAWSGIILFLGIPLLALITWSIRRLAGIRSHRHYLGYVFGGLWLIGLISILTLSGMFLHNFSSRSLVEDTYPLTQPSAGKLYINVDNSDGTRATSHSRWYGHWDDDDMPFYIIDKGSMWLNTVKINVAQSADTAYHVYETKMSRAKTSEEAKNLAGHISFSIFQQDSIIRLPNGFSISAKDKFRNQQVMVIVEVPLGKKIQFNNNIDRYDWFTINVNGHRNVYFEHDWNNSYNYRSNKEYIMTATGLKNTKDSTDTVDSDD